MSGPGPRAAEPPLSPEDDAVALCRDLLRIDSSNPGDGSGPGERAAAELVMAALTEVGWEPELMESAPRRSSVVLRIPGTNPDRPALVLHGHTDVVPARAEEWSVDPFGGEEIDGMLWGRGAVDMKDMDAMILALVRDMGRAGWRPPRDLIVAMFADEEAGGRFGARWVVENRPELFAGATEAVSEVGGFSVDVAGRRVYLIQAAEKGLAWLRLVATGRAGHGSQVNESNAVTAVAQAVARIGAHAWPVELTGCVRRLLEGVAQLAGLPFDPDDPATIPALLDALGHAGKFVGTTVATSANPTGLAAGYKANVVPARAEAMIDVRFLPGEEERTMRTLAELAGPRVTFEDIHRDIALQAPFATPLVDAMVDAVAAEDPGATVLPYMLSGGTDNKSLARLGITGYGFAPLRLPPGLDFAGMFHGIDERVPIDALRFGVRALTRFVRSC